MRYFVPLAALSLLLTVSLPALAYRDGAVLGSSAEVTDAVFPPVTYGPGHILPDSPFYFIDKLYQDFRLALVFTPANRARLHMAIGGERLAELRVESSRNNQAGVDTALIELGHETMAAANDIRDASSQGQDVTQLARDIHQAMTDYRNVLLNVQSQVSDTAYEQKLAAAADVVWEARTLTEDALPEEDLEHEMLANADQAVTEAVLGIANSTKALERRVNLYNRLASRAAEGKNKKEQEEAIRASASAKQKEIIAERQKAIQEYLAKVQALHKQREEELSQLKKTIQDLQNQLKVLRESERADLKNLRTNSSAKTTLTPTPTPSSAVTTN